MKKKIAIIGLGYVGLPLANAFANKGYKVTGFDINKERIDQLKSGFDITNEIDDFDLASTMHKINFTYNLNEIKNSNIYIVTVPTPIDKFKNPDLFLLKKASEMVGSFLSKNDIIIYESTVYPGATEEVCVPILEENSKLIYNKDFFVGYSPERINPGDKKNKIENIIKVTSGSNKKTAKIVDELYSSIISAGTYMAKSIKVAEAAKVIENAQRDINIAFMNELSKIFHLMDIETNDVLQAASTKWNFLQFKPGLVGGHCIGVDPYYLASKSIELGFNPKIILSGRDTNDNMSKYVAKRVIQLMKNKKIEIKGSRALILGITFKENCPDIRNTKVVDIISEFHKNKIETKIYDPIANPSDVLSEYGLEIENEIPDERFDVIVLSVAHKSFLNIDFESIKKINSVIFDVKSILEDIADESL